MQQLKSVDDYFPLFLDQTMQLYALRMKDNEEQADHVVRLMEGCIIFVLNTSRFHLG